MKISYKWLLEYIDIKIPAKETKEILTNIGLEVEGLEHYESVRGGLKGCFTGEVLSCEKHPEADRLSITTVDIGQAVPLSIVCGAPNVKKGQKVVVATVGTTLYHGDESLSLKKVKIRGIASEGMICAEDELGLGDSHEGIMVLPPETEIGTEAAVFFNIQSDQIFEIGLTPNRIDGASHYGVARDLAAFLSLKSDVKLNRPSVDGFSPDNNDLHIDVVIENTEACKRYSGLTLTDIDVRESPGWLSDRLRSIGLKPVNNVVDITNYVLHETGQPLHAFDANKIKGNKVLVKTLEEGTIFTTLDGIERSLSDQDLMICDAENGMCIAGVFGGIDSGISESTRNIFLESAYFDPVYVRRTSKRHLLNTDASFRFERGADPNNTVYALKRAAMLISEIAGGKISSDIVDVCPVQPKAFPVNMKYKNIYRLIGKNIAPSLIIKILEALEIEILNQNEEGLHLLVPPYRVDVKREADVIEEILRIYGYNNVEIREQMSIVISPLDKPDKEKISHMVSDYLSSSGFNEIICNSLSKEEYYQDRPEAVKLFNPLSSDLGYLRTTLLYGGLETLAYNSNRKMGNLKIFEFGNCYSRGAGESLDKYHEEVRLALFISGNKYEGNWIEKEQASSIFELKAFVENIFLRLGLDLNGYNKEKSEEESFSEGMRLSAGNASLAEFGVLKQSLLDRFELRSPVFFADIRWASLLKQLTTSRISVSGIPKFPEVRRDLSMILEKDISFDQIREISCRMEKNLLKSVSLFDVYEGERITSGKKSYAVGFVLQDPERTLTDSQIDSVMGRIQSGLEKEIGAQIRK